VDDIQIALWLDFHQSLRSPLPLLVRRCCATKTRTGNWVPFDTKFCSLTETSQ
jgi:hypothetical protein